MSVVNTRESCCQQSRGRILHIQLELRPQLRDFQINLVKVHDMLALQLNIKMEMFTIEIFSVDKYLPSKLGVPFIILK